jgi:hypothetical protein
MEENLKSSIFNPKDNLDESTNFNEAIYLDFVRNEFKSLVRKHKCKYDIEKHKWYTIDKNNTIVKDVSKYSVDFWALMNDLGVSYGKENKCWYTFYLNEKNDKKYFL